MILLTSTSDKLQVITGSGVSTVNVHASFMDFNGSVLTPGRTNSAITTATTTDIVASPGASTQRNIKSITIYNSHVSSSDVITIQHTDGSTIVILFKYTLLAGQTIQYFEGQGFQVTDATGSVKINTNASLDASAITTGQLALAHGGTAADLSATGGTSQVLRQSSVGAVVTVSQPAASDLSNGVTGTGAVVLAGDPTLTGTVGTTGTIQATIAGGATLINTAASTNFKFMEFQNTGGDFYFGVESSVGGAFFTGSNAYDSVLYTGGGDIFVSTPHARFSEIVNALTGYQQNSTAGSGHVLRGNGTTFVDAALAAADLSDYLTSAAYSPSHAGFTETGTGFSSVVGQYTKIGKLVFFSIQATVASASTVAAASPGAASFSLPLTAAFDAEGNSANDANIAPISVQIHAGSAFLGVVPTQTAATIFYVSGTYMVS